MVAPSTSCPRPRPTRSACAEAPAEVAEQLIDVVRAVSVPLDHVVLHPIPDPRFPDDPERGYTARVAREVLPRVRAALGAST